MYENRKKYLLKKHNENIEIMQLINNGIILAFVFSFLSVRLKIILFFFIFYIKCLKIVDSVPLVFV